MNKGDIVSTEFGRGTVFDFDSTRGEVYVSMDDRKQGELCFYLHEISLYSRPEPERKEKNMLHKGNRVLSPHGMGTVVWADEKEADVKLDDNGRTLGFDLEELTHLDYQAEHDVDTDSFEVWAALNFIHQLKERGDAAGDQMHELLNPLAEAYNKLKAGK